MKLKRAIAVIVLVSAFATSLAAGSFEDAVGAQARGDYAKALRLIRPLANDGDAAAQFNLGQSVGQGVQKDEAAAAQWFRKAAEQGYAAAQCNLGSLQPAPRISRAAGGLKQANTQDGKTPVQVFGWQENLDLRGTPGRRGND